MGVGGDEDVPEGWRYEQRSVNSCLEDCCRLERKFSMLWSSAAVPVSSSVRVVKLFTSSMATGGARPDGSHLDLAEDQCERRA